MQNMQNKYTFISKTWTQTLNPDPEKPGRQEKCGKQLDAVKRLKDHIVQFIDTKNLLRRDL